MKALVTGSSGHLGEALIRTLQYQETEAVGLDIKASSFTSVTGSITDRKLVDLCMDGVDIVYHTATLHKPHVATHSMQDFIDTNINGTLTLLQSAIAARVKSFIFTSTTSVFGAAMRPSEHDATVWVTEKTQPIPRNIYGVTKHTAEDLCYLLHRNSSLPCIILRTSRFFFEEDDNHLQRQQYSNDNIKVNEFLFRRVDIEDVVSAHLAAARKAADIGFGRYIISATSPFEFKDTLMLRTDARSVVGNYVPEFSAVYSSLGWSMFNTIDRVYVNTAARYDLDWEPQYDFQFVIDCLARGNDFRSPLALEIGAKGYHDQVFKDGPYPVA